MAQLKWSTTENAIDFYTLTAGNGWHEPTMKAALYKGLNLGCSMNWHAVTKTYPSIPWLVYMFILSTWSETDRPGCCAPSAGHHEYMHLRWTKLSPTECKKHREKGLCFYCRNSSGSLCSSVSWSHEENHFSSSGWEDTHIPKYSQSESISVSISSVIRLKGQDKALRIYFVLLALIVSRPSDNFMVHNTVMQLNIPMPFFFS